MKIIVGLGNPGEKYLRSRHNAGFMFVDYLAGKKKFELKKKFEAEIVDSDGIMLVKPTTFMNESGRSVRKIIDFYKLDARDIVVVHDDLDILFGQVKTQFGVGPKVHNGLNSVEEYLGTKDFLRVRLGVDNRGNNKSVLTGADYVLDNFGNEEQKTINKTIKDTALELLVTLGLQGK